MDVGIRVARRGVQKQAARKRVPLGRDSQPVGPNRRSGTVRHRNGFVGRDIGQADEADTVRVFGHGGGQSLAVLEPLGVRTQLRTAQRQGGERIERAGVCIAGIQRDGTRCATQALIAPVGDRTGENVLDLLNRQHTDRIGRIDDDGDTVERQNMLAHRIVHIALRHKHLALGLRHAARGHADIRWCGVRMCREALGGKARSMRGDDDGLLLAAPTANDHRFVGIVLRTDDRDLRSPVIGEIGLRNPRGEFQSDRVGAAQREQNAGFRCPGGLYLFGGRNRSQRHDNSRRRFGFRDERSNRGDGRGDRNRPCRHSSSRHRFGRTDRRHNRRYNGFRRRDRWPNWGNDRFGLIRLRPRRLRTERQRGRTHRTIAQGDRWHRNHRIGCYADTAGQCEHDRERHERRRLPPGERICTSPRPCFDRIAHCPQLSFCRVAP